MAFSGHHSVWTECRACARMGPSLPLDFIMESVNVPLWRMLIECTEIELHYNDGFPEFMCRQCVDTLFLAYKFKKRAIDTMLKDDWENYNRRELLREENTQQTGYYRYYCRHCDRYFANLQGIQSHNCNNNQHFLCFKCNQVFFTKNVLYKHLKYTHSILPKSVRKAPEEKVLNPCFQHKDDPGKAPINIKVEAPEPETVQIKTEPSDDHESAFNNVKIKIEPNIA